MDRRQLEYFLAVAAHGSFTSAAAALHVAQPSLSHAVKAVEREVGAQLFHRQASSSAPHASAAARRLPKEAPHRGLEKSASALEVAFALE